MSEKIFHGFAVSHGLAEGKVKIIKNKAAFKTFKKDEVLVTPFLTPDYASVVHKAKAVIADTGAIMSHVATVVRELRIPCLMGTKNAAAQLKNGDTIRLDTKRGIVEVVAYAIRKKS